jgi:uncharacterized protein YkwD
MKRIATLVGLSLLVSLVLAGNAPARVLKAPVGTCANADNPYAPVGVQEAAMKCLINLARAQAGLPRLGEDGKLNSSAVNKAGDILRCNQFSHQACGRDFLYWFRKGGYVGGRCWWAGENLAWGSGQHGSPRAVIKAWMRSSAHRANILSPEYSEFGLSLRFGSLSGNPDAHVWVNHFGRHC